MIFFCSHFNIQEEEKSNIFGKLCFIAKKCKNATEMQKISAVPVKSGLQFQAGDFWLDNAPRLGRPVEVDSN